MLKTKTKIIVEGVFQMSQDCPSLISDVVFITIICRLTVNEKLGSELIDLDV